MAPQTRAAFLRRLLMSCKSKPIWQSARLNVIGLPACPQKLSEPAYAAQLYTKICTSCGNRAIQHMDPVLLVRLCGKCKKSQLVDLAAEYDIDESLVFNSKTILPGYNSDFYTDRGPWCFNEDLRFVKSALDAFDENGHEEAKQAWIEQRQEIVNAREESAEPLIEWFQDLEAEREAELDLRKQARKTEIKSRLQKLGYGKQDMDFENWGGWFSRVYNASPLTDKGKGYSPLQLKEMTKEVHHSLERIAARSTEIN
ncbi:unnamed protein product [Rhizoctonia solani]|uniref:Uncharacterized protein n=1 Tax=Rhizoctonia solani TaxID=456999 RepID=A0A8H2WLI8_9AGAM|nr:unnamed protein product [Rhizoctonia solani]